MAEEPDNLEEQTLPEASRREIIQRRIQELEARKAERSSLTSQLKIVQERKKSEQEAEEQRGVLTDSLLAVPKGIENALESTIRLIGDVGESLDESLADLLGLPSLGSPTFGSAAENGIIGFMSPQEFADFKAKAKLAGVATGFQAVDFDLFPEAETTVGLLVQGVTQFTAGFIGAGKLLKGVKFLQGTSRAVQLGRAATAGAIADFTVFDPDEGRLSDLLVGLEVNEDDNPALAALKRGLNNDLTQFLASDEDDSRLEGRIKNAFEGLIAGGIIDGFVQGLRVLRAKRVAAKEQKAAISVEQADKDGVKFLEPEPPAPKAVVKEAAEPPKKTTEEPEAPRKDAEEPEPTANKAEEEVAVKEKIKVTEDQARAITSALEEGDLSKAQGLLDFNENTIDWDKLGNDPEGIRKIINTFSEVLADNIDEAGSAVQPLVATRRLANLVGSSAEVVHKLHANVRDGGGLAARVLASERVMLASAQRVQRLAKELKAQRKAGVKDVQKMAQFHRQVELHGAIQAEIKGAKSEVARALHAMRALKAASEESFSEFDRIRLGSQLGGTKADYDDFLEQFIKSKNPAGLNNLVRKTVGKKIQQVITEIYINGLLSGVKTQVVNVTSNFGQVFLGIADRFIAAGVGSVRKAALGLDADQVVTFREAFGFLEGTMRGLVEGTVLAGRAIKTRGPVSDPVQKVQFATRKAIHIDASQIREWQASANYGKAFFARGYNVIGELIRIPGTALVVGDEFFKGIARTQEIYALAARNANLAADAKIATGSLKKSGREAFVKKFKDGIIKDPSAEIQAEAVRFARKQTFQEAPGEVGRKVEGLLNKAPIFKLMVAPFLRTPMNIVKQGAFERGPLGLISAGVRAPKEIFKTLKGAEDAFLRGGKEADIAIAKMTVGAGAMLWASSLVTDGKLIGNRGGYTNSAQLDGVQPYSIFMFGRWIPYNRFDPLGILLGFTADYTEIVAAADDPLEDEEFAEEATAMLGAGIAAMYKNVLSKTWMKSLSDLQIALARTEKGGKADGLTKFIQDSATNLIPFSSLQRSANIAIDPTAREAFDLSERWRRKVIGADGSLPLKRDLLGRPVERSPSVASFWNPFASTETSKDAFSLELSRLAFDFTPQSKTQNGIRLTSTEYSRALEVGGQLLKNPNTGENLEQSLRSLVASNDYKSLPFDEAKSAEVKRLISLFMTTARAEIITEGSEFYNADLAKRVLARKIETDGRRLGATQSQIEEELRKLDQ